VEDSVQEEETPRPAVPSAMWWLAAAAGGLWLMLLTTLGGSPGGGMDRGLAIAARLLLGLPALWVALAALLLLGGRGAALPGWVGPAAVIVLPMSGMAAFLGLDRSAPTPWGFYSLALLPGLFVAYAFWARLPWLHRALPPGPTSAAVWGFAGLLSLAALASV